LPSRSGPSEIPGFLFWMRNDPGQIETHGSLNRLRAIAEFIRSVAPASGATLAEQEAERFEVVLRRRTIERAGPAST
jgi:hypothetical protein